MNSILSIFGGATKNKALKEINSVMEAAIGEIARINIVDNETSEEIKNILSEELQKIPINNLVNNKKEIIKLITEELKFNNRENNNKMGYKISRQSLKEIGSKILTKYSNTPHKWQNYIKFTNNTQINKNNYLTRK